MIRNYIISEEEKRLSYHILKWLTKENNFLNISTLPMNSPLIFLNGIISYAQSKKKVIYITNEKEDNIKILRLIKRYTDFRNYSYIRRGSVNINSYLWITNFNNAVNIIEKFDLVIYDDINSFPRKTKEEIRLLMQCLCKDKGKQIIYSIDKIFYNKEQIFFNGKVKENPMVEPRIITTRINLNDDIPYIIYDFINWSIINNRRVTIYVPDEKKMFKVKKYISRYFSTLKIYAFGGTGIKNSNILKFIENRLDILITDNYEEFFMQYMDMDIIVFFADDIRFDYRALTYICGKVVKRSNCSKGEIIFLSNHITESMDRAKSIIRNFNKEAWDMKFIKN